MAYSELAYFNGDHCAHVAAWQDAERAKNLAKVYAAIERNRR